MTLLGTAALSALLIVATGAANAEVVKLQADLKGSNEVPPNNSSGSGKAEATFDTDTTTLTYTITFAGLTG
ncbi:CHRD domain-containing protein, partial [Acinetobacter baumannii]|uniref:CHRD domain-containing protein n=1 Tax=Acinetobacter baumannii TaxID=470 RepID=UPI001111CF66